MQMKKKMLGVTAGVLTLSAVTAGGVYFTESGSAVTSAQTPSATSTPNARQLQAQADENTYLNDLAKNLGVDRSKLDSALKQTAKDEVTQALQAGTITQSEATTLNQRIDSDTNPPGLGIGHGPGGFDGVGIQQVTGLQDEIDKAFQQTVGETQQQFRQEVQAGKTPAQVFAAHNTTAQAVGQAESAAAKPLLDQAVQQQKITQAQETSFLQRLQNGPGFGFGGPGGPGGHGGPPNGANPQATPTATH